MVSVYELIWVLTPQSAYIKKFYDFTIITNDKIVIIRMLLFRDEARCNN